MKRTIFIFTMAAFISSCGGSDENPDDADKNTTENKTIITKTSTDPDVEKGLDLVTKNDCLTCHKVDEKFTGPSYVEVAKRYAAQPDIEDTLMQKIITGGSGNWGTVPMMPHPNLSEDDARAMVKYILSLKAG